MPSVIDASARLKGGQPSGSLMKSVTDPARMRSVMLPSAPPTSMPVGSQISRLEECRAKYSSSTRRAMMITIVTAVWLFGSRPNATPRLRVFTRCTPGSSWRSSPRTIELSTACLVSRSTSSTPERITAARTQATDRRPGRRPSRSSTGRIGRSAVDETLDDDAVDALQAEDGKERAEVDPPECRDHPAKDAQEWFADVPQKPEHDIRRARVGRTQSNCEQQLDDDPKDDQQRVHVDQRRQVFGDLRAGAGEDHRGRAMAAGTRAPAVSAFRGRPLPG